MNAGTLRRAALMALVLALLTVAALPAFAGCNLAGARAVPNQPLAFRTGPGTWYGELDTLPQDTAIVAIELEDGNDVPWVLCEFQYKGSRVRAYTGLKRMTLQGYVPYASHDRLTRRLVNTSEVYAAPDMRAKQRAVLPKGTKVLFLGFEGEYCFIEYRNGEHTDRGYVHEFAFTIDQDVFAEAFPENNALSFYVIKPSAPLFTEPDWDSEVLFDMPFDASVTMVFDDLYESTGDGWVPVYYGGLLGYARAGHISDLRFDDPETARKILSSMDEYEN